MPDAVDLFRCPSCGASNATDAEWCGQCHRRFGGGRAQADSPIAQAPSAERAQLSSMPATGVATAGPLVQTREGADPVWTCPACDHVNPLTAQACARCGSQFTSFFPNEEEKRAAKLSKNTAIGLTAVLPGVGHWAFHELPAAVARALLYVWSVGIGIMLLARPPASARALVRGVGVCFALSAIAIWLLSMLETMRLTAGDHRPLIPPKWLTWFTAGLSSLLFFGLLGAVIAAR
jgi:ribosomal protein L40E